MPSQETKKLELNQYLKSDKMRFIVYAVLGYLIEKIDRRKNNSEKSFTAKVGEHILSGFSMSTVWSYKDRK